MKHILAVDDNKTNLAAVSNALRPYYKVTCLNSGVLALQFLKKETVDLILLDLIMPEMDGLQVMEKLKSDSRTKGIPVIFLTADTDVETEAKCLESGAQDFVGKPFAVRTLVVRIGRILELETYQRNLEARVKEKTDKIELIQRSIVVNLANVIESRDSDSGHHVKRTGAYVEVTARGLKREGIYADTLTPDYIGRLSAAAALHDIGKIAIPDGILGKPGKLTRDEFEVIKLHTTVGKRLVRECLDGVEGNEYQEMAENIAMYHHERWDGTGYPEKLKREEIPLCARIMAVADVFDALISKRCYKEPYAVEEAFRIIKKSRGSHFDPLITDVFLLCREQIEQIIRYFGE